MRGHVVNADQAEEWDGRGGAYWVQHADRFDALSQRLTPPLLAAAAISEPEHVLDVGCGCGLTTRMAARAAASGSALGVDLSAAMLQEAARRAEAEDLTNVRFEQADAQVHAFPPAAFDLAISRNGAMFFQDPVAAFANIASALRPGGRGVFMWWQDLARNQWLTVPIDAAVAHVARPDPGPPGAPGPFSLADPNRTRAVLTEAGFDDVELTDVAEPVYLGPDATDATEFFRGTGMGRRLLEDAVPAAAREALDAIRGAFEAHQRPDGVWLDSAAWLVRAIRR